MATAEAATPDAAVKEEVWDRIHGDGYSSLRLALAAASGFWRRTQQEILERFVPRFFAGLADLSSAWEQEAFKNYYGVFFPGYRVEESTVDMVDTVLSNDGIGPILRRLLVESKDDVERALRCRNFAIGQ